MRLNLNTTGRKGLFRFGALAIVALAVLLACLHPAEAAKKKKPRHRATASHSRRYVQSKRPAVDRSAMIVIDVADGRVLEEKNADKRLYPASLTKMMTLYLTFEALENGALRKTDRLPVSAHAAAQEPSKLGLEAGTTIRVQDAILALVTKSANDAATVLGESLGDGSELRFGQVMTAKARALGMNNTRFVNASGLFDPAQVSTARDMAKLGLALVRDYPRDYRYFSTPRFTWAGRVMENHNRLMETYNGMDGIKTGYVHQSGFNLVASAMQNGRRLVGVVFGGRTAASRNAQMKGLLDRAFASPRQPRLAAATPQFDAMGLALKDNRPAQEDEGDTDAPLRSGTRLAEDFQPKPISTQTLGAYNPRAGLDDAPALAPNDETWAVQIGSFGSKAAGLQALRSAQNRLAAGRVPARGAAPVVVPLATNRGVIYRARLAGLGRAEAENVCRVLRGNCLILAMQ